MASGRPVESCHRHANVASVLWHLHLQRPQLNAWAVGGGWFRMDGWWYSNASCQSVACCILNEYFMPTFRLTPARLKLCNAMHCSRPNACRILMAPRRESKTGFSTGLRMGIKVKMVGSGFLWPICSGIHFRIFIAATLACETMCLDDRALKTKRKKTVCSNNTL